MQVASLATVQSGGRSAARSRSELSRMNSAMYLASAALLFCHVSGAMTSSISMPSGKLPQSTLVGSCARNGRRGSSSAASSSSMGTSAGLPLSSSSDSIRIRPAQWAEVVESASSVNLVFPFGEGSRKGRLKKAQEALRSFQDGLKRPSKARRGFKCLSGSIQKLPK
eukprot:9473703-Pyramimonas_sp.AAC.1